MSKHTFGVTKLLNTSRFHKITPALRLRALAMAGEGEKRQVIASALGISKETFFRLVKGRKLPTSSPSQKLARKCKDCGHSFLTPKDYVAHTIPSTDGRKSLGDLRFERPEGGERAYRLVDSKLWVVPHPVETRCLSHDEMLSRGFEAFGGLLGRVK